MPSAPDASGTMSTRRLTAVIGTLAVATLIMILNETMLSVALPDLRRDFGVSTTAIGWLTTGFLLVMAIVIPCTGFLLRRFTPRALFIAALTMFLAGTAIAGLAGTFPVMLAARMVQAAGTAIVLPLLMTTTLRLVPPGKRGTVMGLNSVVISVAPALGPTTSGLIIDSLGWRALFWVMMPLVLVALAVGAPCQEGAAETSPDRRARLDAVSVLLSVIACGGIVYGSSHLDAVAHGDWLSPAALVLGVIGTVLFVRRQRRTARAGAGPFLSMSPFRVVTYRRCLLVIAGAMAMMLGTVTVLPIYMRDALQVSALMIGLVSLPAGIIQAILSPIIGRVYDAVGPRPVAISGATLMLTGQAALLLQLGENTAVWQIVLSMCAFGSGMALVMTTLMTHALSVLPRTLYGSGSAILNTVQQLAAALGIALMLGAFVIGQTLLGSAGHGVTAPLLLSTTLAVLGLIGVVRIHPTLAFRRRRAAEIRALRGDDIDDLEQGLVLQPSETVHTGQERPAPGR